MITVAIIVSEYFLYLFHEIAIIKATIPFFIGSFLLTNDTIFDIIQVDEISYF